MNLLNTFGIVIEKRVVNDADSLISVLTKDFGLLKFKINGIEKTKKRDKNAIDVLAHTKFTFYKNKNKLILFSFENLEYNTDIRINLDKIMIFYYLSQVLKQIIFEEQENRKIYDLLLKIVKFMRITDDELRLLLLIPFFLINIIDNEGIELNINEFNTFLNFNDKGKNLYFDFETSTYTQAKRSNSFLLTKKEVSIIYLFLKKNRKIKIETEDRKNVLRVISFFEQYILYHLEIHFKSYLLFNNFEI